MAERSSIEWTESTFSPIRARWLEADGGAGKLRVGWHCEHVSEGCRNCYAEGINRRLGTGFDFKPGHRSNVEVFLDEKMLLAPLKWRRPRRIFVCSMTDLFADFVPDAMIDRVFAIMALARQHTFQCLTKRPARMRAYITAPDVENRVNAAMDDIAPAHWCTREIEDFGGWPLPNLWLGTSTEDQATADVRVPELLFTPAVVRFVSAEPLLGLIDFTNLGGEGSAKSFGAHGFSAFWPIEERPKLDWIITGGESGRSARPMHPAWVRSIRDQCAAAGVALFHKQHGEFRPVGPIFGDDPVLDVDERRCAIVCLDGSIWPDDAGQPPSDAWMMERLGKRAAGRLLDGRTHDAMPEVRHG